MATAQKLINSALRKLGAIGVGEAPDAQESGECLTSLNQMLESWRLERLVTHYIATETKAITATTATVTIGLTAQWNIERPVRIVSAFWRLASGLNLELYVPLTWQEYQAYVTGGLGTPEAIHYEAAYPLGIIHIAPVPVTDGTLVIGIPAVLESFTSLSDDNALSPGFERAIAYNLALELAPEYQLQPSSLVQQIAIESKALIKRNAITVNQLRPDAGLPGTGGGRYNILTD